VCSAIFARSTDSIPKLKKTFTCSSILSIFKRFFQQNQRYPYCSSWSKMITSQHISFIRTLSMNLFPNQVLKYASTIPICVVQEGTNVLNTTSGVQPPRQGRHLHHIQKWTQKRIVKANYKYYQITAGAFFPSLFAQIKSSSLLQHFQLMSCMMEKSDITQIENAFKSEHKKGL